MIRLFMLVLFPFAALASDFDANLYLGGLAESPHLELINDSSVEVSDYEVGLGTLKKVRGVWQFKASERLTGTLDGFTWQIHDGYTSHEVLAAIEHRLHQVAGIELLFSCDGRACGSGAQWASRVFRERLLYGREDLQRYRVYRLAGEHAAGEQWLQLYATARSAERQYLHAQALTIPALESTPALESSPE